MGQIVEDVTSVLTYGRQKAQAETERQKILSQIAADEKQKTNLVKKALAAQRANFGAGGSSGKSMTDQAVLKRLRDEASQPFNEKKRVNKDKIDKIKKPSLAKSLLKTLLGVGEDTAGLIL